MDLVIREEITYLKKVGKGTPQELLRRAEPVDSPIHNYFDWNDSSAGQKYRLLQAAKLLSLKITVVKTGEKQVELQVEEEPREYIQKPERIVTEKVEIHGSYGAGLNELKSWFDTYKDYPKLISAINQSIFIKLLNEGVSENTPEVIKTEPPIAIKNETAKSILNEFKNKTKYKPDKIEDDEVPLTITCKYDFCPFKRTMKFTVFNTILYKDMRFCSPECRDEYIQANKNNE